MAYVLDLTASLPANKVTTKHLRTDPDHWFLRPRGGAFFTRDLVVINNVGSTPLRPLLDYRVLNLEYKAVRMSGKEVAQVIVILNAAVTNITITRRLIGGEFEPVGSDIDEIITDDDINALNSSTWGQIYNRPDSFPPNAHLQDLSDVFGMEQATYQLDEIRRLIGEGSPYGYGAITQYLEAEIKRLEDSTAQRIKDLEDLAGGIAGSLRFGKNMVVITTDNVNPAVTLKYGTWRRLSDTLLHSVQNLADIGTTTRIGEGQSYLMTGVAMWELIGD